MIKNERQLVITKSQLRKFKEHITLIEKQKEKGKTSPLVEAEEIAIKSQIKTFEEQINEYEDLWGSKKTVPKLVSFESIPQTLIKGRISLGLTQKELAELMELKEQQIQRYESTNYESASLSRMKEFAKVLNLEFAEQIKFQNGELTLDKFLTKLRRAGIEDDFIVQRLLPQRVLLKRINETLEVPYRGINLQVINHVSNIFGWTMQDIVNDKDLEINATTIGNIKFKVPKRVDRARLQAYTSYAHYLASIILRIVQHLPINLLPKNPYEIHKNIISTYDSLTLENALRYIWSLGVPVVSIDDPGGFHGVFFKEKTRNVIILKHRTESTATWLYSLFHEFYHAVEHQDDPEQQLFEIEYFDNSASDICYDKEEETASLFAGAVLLGEAVDPLVQLCLKEANHDLVKLKNSVQRVAIRKNIPVDVLANCVSFKLSQIGTNWWGTAQNLQNKRGDIQRIATEVLLDHVDLSQVSGLDLDLLRRALIKSKK